MPASPSCAAFSNEATRVTYVVRDRSIFRGTRPRPRLTGLLTVTCAPHRSNALDFAYVSREALLAAGLLQLTASSSSPALLRPPPCQLHKDFSELLLSSHDVHLRRSSTSSPVSLNLVS